MNIVPAAGAATILGLTASELTRQLADTFCVINNRVFVDITQVPEPQRTTLTEGVAASAVLWDQLNDGTVPEGAAVVRYQLHHARQRRSNGKTGALVELRDELDALVATPVTAQIVEEATNVTVNRRALHEAGLRAGVDLTVKSKRNSNDTVIDIVTSDHIIWPEVLGGATWPGELTRAVRLVVNHAAGRDRRSRRLTEVTVTTDTIWATSNHQ